MWQRSRSREKERIDAPDLDLDAVRLMHRELSVINRWLGGTGSSVREIARRCADGAPSRGGAGRDPVRGDAGRAPVRGDVAPGAFAEDERARRPLFIIDVGAGGADLPLALLRWAARRKREVRVIVLDRDDAACTAAAETFARHPHVFVVRGDALALPLAERSVDVAHAALLLHHFDDDGVVRAARELRRVARRGALANDLHRHWFAWWAIRVLTAAFARSPLIRHDAPLSVRRGFRRHELARLLSASSWTPEIRWRWAFRYLAWTNA